MILILDKSNCDSIMFKNDYIYFLLCVLDDELLRVIHEDQGLKVCIRLVYNVVTCDLDARMIVM